MRLTAPVATEIDYDLRWRTANIPAPFRGLTLEGWPPYNDISQRAHKAASRLVQTLPDRRRPREWTPAARAILGVGMTLFGPPGSGKSSLACAMLVDAHYTHGATIHYLKTSDYIIRAQELISYERDPARREAHHDRYSLLLEERLRAERVSLLVFDDLGQEYDGPSGHGRSLVVRLLRGRHEHARPTIVTSNKSPKDWHTYDLSLPSFAAEALPAFPLLGRDMRRAA